MKFPLEKMRFLRAPKHVILSEEKIEITTEPHTDLWQRTYYHFRNDSAPILLLDVTEKFFSFTVKCSFEPRRRFDQCGVALYLDSENWIKASIEYETPFFAHLGSVVTSGGYSDWATTRIEGAIPAMWYRLSRREDDFCIECSQNGKDFSNMRICHLEKAQGSVPIGIYACSPEDSSFQAAFSEFSLTECLWQAHDGQPPDEE